MAHEIDMSNERENMAYTEDVPWHGLGQELERDASLEQWQEAAGLNWSAVKSPVMFHVECEDGLPDLDTFAKKFVLHRSDNGRPLGIVSDRYCPVQPNQIIEFFQTVVEELGAFEMETLGALFGGRKVWALARAKEDMISLAGDEVRRYLLLATSYDGSINTVVQQTSVRVVCNNTLSVSYRRGEKQVEPVLKIKHFQNFSVANVRQRMHLENDWAEFAVALDKMASKKMSVLDARDMFMSALGVDPDWKRGKVSNQLETKLGRLEEIRENAPGQDAVSAKDTVWGVVNALTYFVDHENTSRVGNVGRIDKAWFGEGAIVKSRAMSHALELVS